MNSLHTVILFYRFVRIEDPAKLRDAMRALAEAYHLKGRMLIAHEGVNATFEGMNADILAYKAALRGLPIFADVVFKESSGTGNAFQRLEIKVRSEVVTLGAGDFDVEFETAPTITAQELERMYTEADDFVVLDLRNDYETAVGKFENTIDPGLTAFRDLPGKLQSLSHLKDKKVVAVCTGGIRCEKATCLLKKEGFTNVVQLKDGIHTYMQEFPNRHFKGSLFVFDNRMTTPVLDVSGREVIGACEYCASKTETYYNDDSVRPSRKIICCDTCFDNHPGLRPSVTAHGY